VIMRPGTRAVRVALAGLAFVVWIAWATLFRLPAVELRYPFALKDLGPRTCGDCTFVTRLARESLRVFTPLADLPPTVPVAVVWVEDSGFWVHGGVDWVRLRAAAFRDLTARRYRVGASTITMQLARKLFLSRERSLLRKAREISYALALERRWDKSRILEVYLNEVDFGRGLHGIGAAACYYFAEPPTDLTRRQAWKLATILRSPDRLAARVARSPCARAS
jgi:monofunctional biosynthetic peptidoglycan transglycosylase